MNLKIRLRKKKNNGLWKKSKLKLKKIRNKADKIMLKMKLK